MTPQLTRRGLLGGTFGLAATSFLVSCGDDQSGEADRALRVFMFNTGSEWENFKKATNRYQKNSKTTFNLSNLGGGATVYLDKLRTQLTGGSAPDLFQNWGGQLAGPFIESQLVAPLDEHYKEYGWNDTLLSAAVDMCSKDGTPYGVPIAQRALGIVYRKDFFEEYGLNEAKTYEDLENACTELRKAGIAPITLGGRHEWHPMRLVQYLLEYTAGPSLHDELLSLNTSWDRSEVVDAFSLFKRWVDNEWIPKGFMGTSYDDANLLWYQGNAAMIPEGSDEEVDIRTQDIDGGIFIFPSGHDNVRYMSFIEQLMLPAGSSTQDEAAEFIDWLIQADQQAEFSPGSTATKDGLPENMSNWPLTNKWQEAKNLNEAYLILDQALSNELANEYFAIQAAIVDGGTTPKQAAADMQRAVSNSTS